MKKHFPLFCVIIFLFCRIFVPAQNMEVQHLPHAIIYAAYIGDIELMKQILETDYDKDIRDTLGGTALHVAIFQDNLEAIKLLLDNGFDINAASFYHGYTPLHYCVWTNNLAAANLLVSYNADKNIKDMNGHTPLEKATREGKRDILLILSRR